MRTLSLAVLVLFGPGLAVFLSPAGADQPADIKVVETDDYVQIATDALKAGSCSDQSLVFQPRLRYVLSSERITSVNDVDDLFYRIDMPGHIRHQGGDTFSQVYLSYQGLIPAADFLDNFAPDAKFLYQRKQGKIPGRMIRAYQVKLKEKEGPWLA